MAFKHEVVANNDDGVLQGKATIVYPETIDELRKYVRGENLQHSKDSPKVDETDKKIVEVFMRGEIIRIQGTIRNRKKVKNGSRATSVAKSRLSR